MYQQAVRACWKSDDIKATAMRSGICRRIQEFMKRTECLVSVLFFLIFSATKLDQWLSNWYKEYFTTCKIA